MVTTLRRLGGLDYAPAASVATVTRFAYGLLRLQPGRRRNHPPARQGAPGGALVVHGAFAESMIARGPTLAADRETATGSLYVLGLPSVDAAREFVAREPNNRACVYADHFIWRFENLLGRTMWEFSGVADEPRFLVIARLDRDHNAGQGQPEESLAPELRERLIVCGALSTLDDGEPAGVALAFRSRTETLSSRSSRMSGPASTSSRASISTIGNSAAAARLARVLIGPMSSAACGGRNVEPIPRRTI
jgi:hypothetical protein